MRMKVKDWNELSKYTTGYEVLCIKFILGDEGATSRE